MRYIRVVLPALFFCLLFSCGKRVYFTDHELSWFNVYHKNDVLVFQNTLTYAADISFISKKELYHHYDWFLDSKYSHHTAVIKYSNINLKNTQTPAQGYMFNNTKRLPVEPERLSVAYLNSHFFKKHNDPELKKITLEITGRTFSNVYVLSDSRKGYKYAEAIYDYTPETLYWDIQYGIIKYVTYKGEVWERINW